MQLKINGSLYDIDIDDDVPLLWVIRDEVGLTGTKFGCGKGLCGACTVHLNGVAIRSCVTPVSAVVGQEISTIEGLASKDGKLHPLQQAWIKHNVPQCGYCQPGQLMTAAALIAQNPTASDEDIELAMSGNICRCGTYQRIKAAIKDVVSQPAQFSQQQYEDLAYEVKV